VTGASQAGSNLSNPLAVFVSFTCKNWKISKDFQGQICEIWIGQILSNQNKTAK